MPTLIPLTEYVPCLLPADTLSATVGEKLWHHYDVRGHRIKVDFPTPKTNHQWQLINQGWVGYIPLTPDLHLVLQPKVTLHNLFWMLAYAYRLTSFEWLPDLMKAHSLQGFYEGMAALLAQLVLNRARLGFYRSYLPCHGRLPYVRGQLDQRNWVTPPQTTLLCHYEQFTADIADNQILAYTLAQIAHSGYCHAPTQTLVRQAWRSLQQVATMRPFPPEACVGRQYGRLNQDYYPMHALCRFFLEHTVPTQEPGHHTAIPFLVNMARLYELFVAEWLQCHLPPAYHLKIQERVDIDPNNVIHFNVDLVLYHHAQSTPLAVLDTKYKTTEAPPAEDVAQILAYAQVKQSKQAILIYPTPLPKPLNTMIGNIQLRSLTFALNEALDSSGQHFLTALWAIEQTTNKGTR